MDLLAGLVLGAVQGVAEWLPISSKTQVMLASILLLGLGPAHAYSLGLLLEVGSVAAALLYFRREYLEVLRALAGRGTPLGRKALAYVALATAVTGLLGVPLYLAARRLLSVSVAPGLLMAALGAAVLANALLLWRAGGGGRGGRGLADLTLRDMLLVGAAQALSALPGVSRSGVTTTALLLLGLAPAEAFRASFLLVPPAGVGAALLSLLAEGEAVGGGTALAAVASSVPVSLATIWLLLRLGRRAVLANLVVGLLAVAGGLAQLAVGG